MNKNNEQIIIDDLKISKEDFIDNFAIELTNRNIFEREQIGNKYFNIILRKEQECEELTSKCSQLKQTIAEIKEIAEQIENNDLYVTVPAKVRIGDKIKINLIGIQDILNIISEVDNES